MDIKKDKVCLVNHSRKGEFYIKIVWFDDTWVTGEIISGKASALLPENEREKGENITVRKSLCTFTELKIKEVV